MLSRLTRPAATILPALAGLLATLALAPAQLAPRPAAPPPALPPKLLDEEATAKLLAQLDDVSKTVEEKKYGHHAGVIRDLREASSSSDKALNLWLDSVKIVDYERQGKTGAEFLERKLKETKDPNRKRDATLQLEIKWLTVVVMDANARTEAARAEVVTAAAAYVEDLLAFIKKFDAKITPSADVLAGHVSRRLNLDKTLVRRKEAATANAGNIAEIYITVILPYYRRSVTAANLMQAWNRCIEQETAAAAAAGFPEARERFEQERLPSLKWRQMLDMFEVGQEQSAAPAMISHIRSNMAHAEVEKWTDELRQLLTEQKAAAPQRTEATIPPAPDSAPAPVVDPAPQPTTPGPVVDPAPEAGPAPASPAPKPAATPDPTPVENPFPDEEPLRDPTKAEPAL